MQKCDIQFIMCYLKCEFIIAQYTFKIYHIYI